MGVDLLGLAKVLEALGKVATLKLVIFGVVIASSLAAGWRVNVLS